MGNSCQYCDEIPLHTPRRDVIIKPDNTGLGEDVEKLGLFTQCCWACKVMQLVWKPVRQFFRKLDGELLSDSAAPVHYVYPEK